MKNINYNMQLPRIAGSRILVEQEFQEESSILIIPDEAKDELRKPTGIVVDFGSAKDVLDLDINVGWRVYFNKYAGERVMFGNKEFLILRPSEILAHEEVI